jgi:hypothetical protein
MLIESRRARLVLAALLISAAAGDLCAEGGVGSIFPALSSALPTEAPSSIFDAKLGKGPDADAEILATGSWSASLISSLAFQAQPGSSLAFATTQPLLFTQDPDFSVSLLMYKKYFFQARDTSNTSMAMLSMGYRGGKDELLKEAKVGNDGIDFPDLPFLSFGSGSYRSVGASVLVGNDDFQGKAMIRYDQASRVEKRFVGSTEVNETVLGPNAFAHGMFFLTLNAPATDLVVYVQSSSGTLIGNDGNAYRRLDASEYSYSAMTGLVKLSAAATTRVLAQYPSSGAGSDAVTVSGSPCDLLYVPAPVPATGSLDPKLEALNYYATTATAATAEVFVRNPSSGARDQSYQATITDSGYIEVTQSGLATADATSPAARSAYRQPFASQSYAGMPWIYSTDFSTTLTTGAFAPVYTRNVVVRTFSSSTVVTIDKDFVAGSIEVTRNGVPDYAFSANADSGIVTFVNPPSSSDNIIISYLRESSDRKSGIILGALGGFWDLGSGRSAWTALGASWSVPGSSYSSAGTTSPGSVSLSAGEKDTGGAFQSSAAIAAKYARDDSTGNYRIESMESTTDYATSFRPMDDNAQSYFTATETAETALASSFPTQINGFHSDGTTQKALQIAANSGVSSATPSPNPDIAQYYKVEDAPPYASFGSFSFYAKLPPQATLTVTLDDGAPIPSASVSVTVPKDSTRSALSWERYALHYGKGDSAVYIQDRESGAERVLPGASSTSPSLSSVGSRLYIAVSGLDARDVASIDEVLLEDSVGSVSLLFQGTATYDNPKLMIGNQEAPILSDISASAFAQGALASTPYASGGGSAKAKLGFVGLGINGRAVVSTASTSFSGGHSIELPVEDFPVKLKDSFDYDPASGAFGRSDSVALQGGSVASLRLAQTSAWTPPATDLDSGMLLQSWKGELGLGPSFVTIGLAADNRALPTAGYATAGPSGNYAAAWLSAFRFVLPEDEAYSEMRDVTASLSIKGGGSREYLAASLGASASPNSSGTGALSDIASIRIAAPFSVGALNFEPYYSRAWKDQRSESAGSIVGDAESALGNLANLPLLYRGIPFAELSSPGTASDFAAESAVSGTGLSSASYLPEAGIKFSREYGSKWFDLIAPSALDFYYGRSLARATDTVTDASVYSATAKIAAINVFGAMGAYPLGLPFDSDEYLTTIQGELDQPRDGSASSLNLMYHGLATLYYGQADRFDTESKVSIAELPSSLNWTGSLSLSLSRRPDRDWLLDLYSLAIKPGVPKAEEEEGKRSSLASAYLSDLATRGPTIRNTWTLIGGLAGVRSDASAYLPGWSLTETYETKLTVPERLTLKVDASLSQSLDASSQVLTLGLQLSINAVISF